MTDHLTPAQRSKNMSRIPGKDTSIELKVRRWLFGRGYRYRKHDRRYPGHPDIVLPMYRTVIFVNGCFWHRHQGCRHATMPKTNTDFWQAKFDRNVRNDILHREQLEDMGWTVITLWECEINNDFEETMTRLETMLRMMV